jgi:hypothetical protein
MTAAALSKRRSSIALTRNGCEATPKIRKQAAGLTKRRSLIALTRNGCEATAGFSKRGSF